MMADRRRLAVSAQVGASAVRVDDRERDANVSEATLDRAIHAGELEVGGTRGRRQRPTSSSSRGLPTMFGASPVDFFGGGRRVEVAERAGTAGRSSRMITRAGSSSKPNRLGAETKRPQTRRSFGGRHRPSWFVIGRHGRTGRSDERFH
jgi:hypothetical protein